MLGGLAAAGVGATSYFLGRPDRPVHGLRAAAPLADSEQFAYVGGALETEGRLSVEVAVRERESVEREVVLFPDEDPVRTTMPPLRSFWRFDAPVAGRSPGTGRVRVGDATFPVERTADAPTGADAAVRATPEITWQSDNVAHVRGYGDRNGGRVTVAFRARTDGSGPDVLELRDPDDEAVARHTVPDGVRETTFAVPSLVAREAAAELVSLREGREVDSVPLFYH